MVGKNKLATTKASRLSVAAVPLGLLLGLSPIFLCPILLSACNQSTGESKVAGTNSSDQLSNNTSGSANSSASSTSSGAGQAEDIIALSPEAIKNAAIKSQPIKDMSYESDIKTTGELKADRKQCLSSIQWWPAALLSTR
jgi:hypothetical protein